ncbi:MAG: 2,3-bisphosphoglycerate-dependent phosphoglycerate mutase [Candidatus Pelagibacter bacterium]|jgi:2,3-bisphosphoglycerate-dependent phosphoglycerate mutase|nr:2,3-bisphosphoglycerate-dependent phosphoglycerate mutase [Candidatus Pelagibacter bacterium]
MSHLILVRHGQSEWNLQNRFTGWVDVELAEKGKLEACKAGELIKDLNIKIDYFFCSYQKRSMETLKLILNTIRIENDVIKRAWQLNERHYGALTGLNKDEMKKVYGEKKVHEFRRSWDVPPEPLKKNNPYHPINIETYKDIPREKIPDTESLKNTYERVIPYFKENILTKIDKNILIAAHGNSIRAICKYLFNLDENKITKLEIPTGNPLILKFDENKKLIGGKYLDKERAKDLLVFN